MMQSRILLFILQVTLAVIFAQAILFKLQGSDEARALFSQIGMEPGGRILIGILELISVILLIVPGAAVFGAILGLGIMLGAFIGHFTVIGFEGEAMFWFAKACLAAICCLAIIYVRRQQVPAIRAMFE